MTAPYAEAVVIGAGIAGLTAAHRLRAHGIRPVVLEAADRVGGTVVGGTVGGYEIDLGAESFGLRRPEVRELAEELGLEVQEPAGGSSVWAPQEPGGPGRAVRIPGGSILGIPSDPWAPDVVAVLGRAGAAEAARDLELGPAVGADATDLADLVRRRMGPLVLDRLVRPIAGGIHSTDPSALAVDTVVPGLRQALAEEGSLTGAVAALRARSGGGAVACTVGGMLQLPRALAAAVAADGEVRTGSRVTGLRRVDDDGWEVLLQPSPPAPAERLRTARVVLAAPGPAAVALLNGVVDTAGVDLPTGNPIAHVTLLVDAPDLDAAPRGAGLLVAAGTREVRAKALTHATAKWAWLAARMPPGRHVLRVSYGRPGDSPEELASVGPDLARQEAATLLGTPLSTAQVRDARLVRWDGALPPVTPQLRKDVTALADQVTGLAGLALTGAWVAGTGLAAVVPHAQAAADRLAPAAAPAI